MPNNAMRSAVRVLSRSPTMRLQTQATPDTLANLVAWGEGSDLGADGSSIASWLNKTGSGLDPAQGTGANQPTVKANGINGQKAAAFDESVNQGLLFPAGALGWFQNVNGATFAAVVQPTANLAGTRVLVRAERGTTTGPRLQLAAQPSGTHFQGVARALDTDAGGVITAGTLSVNTPTIVSLSADFTVPTASLAQSGGVVGQVTPASTGPTSNTASLGISLGDMYTLAAGNGFTGYIGAYAMWNAAYTTTQLAPVLRRWSAIYGIPLL